MTPRSPLSSRWTMIPSPRSTTNGAVSRSKRQGILHPESGESITLSNLPAGIGYTITETAQDGWTLLNLNPAETGVVPQNDTAKVVFTNLKNSPDTPMFRSFP